MVKKNGRIRHVLDMNQSQWSALCVLIAVVQTPEEAGRVLPEGLELHQGQVCCHLNLVFPWQTQGYGGW